MSKPNAYVDWARTYDVYTGTGGTYDGQANKLDVTTGQTDNGWEPSKKPSAENMNRWQNLLGQWTRWLDAGDKETQRYLIDLATQSLFRGAIGSGSVETCQYAIAPTTDAAYPSTRPFHNNQVGFQPGILFQGASGGGLTDDAMLLGYWFDGTELVTIANNASSDPRVDLIQMKLELDDTADLRRVKRTISVKQGATGSSPVIPSLDSGYCALATVVVGGNYAAASAFQSQDTAGAVAVLHDQRMPMGFRDLNVNAGSFLYSDANFTYSQAGQFMTRVGAGPGPHNPLTVQCPTILGRLLNVTVVLQQAALSAVTSPMLIAYSGFTTSGQLFWTKMNACQSAPLSTGDVLTVRQPASQWEIHHNPLAGPTVQPSADGKLGCPVWANGLRTWSGNIGQAANASFLYGDPSGGDGTIGDVIYRVGFQFAGVS